MEQKNVRKLIISLLKHQKYVTLDELFETFDKDDHDEVVRVLGDDLKNFIVHDDKKGYRFEHNLGPKPKAVPDDKIRFSQVQARMAAGLDAFPEDFTTPEVRDLVPLDQAEVGDCVGCSGASLAKMQRCSRLNVHMTPEQLASVKRNQKNEDGVLIDVLPDDTVSVAAIYNMARLRINPPPALADEGAHVVDAADVVVDEGVVPEWMWPTSKTDEGQYVTPPGRHAVLVKNCLPLYRCGGGWAIIDGDGGDPTDQLMRTISAHQGCWMTIPIFDNVSDGYATGDFPDPTQGVSKIIGYHAVVACGWYRDVDGKRRWRFVNSWFGTTPLINTISDEGYMKPYYRMGHIQLVALMPTKAVPFLCKGDVIPSPNPNPVPEPEPEPVPSPKPVSIPVVFITGLIEAFRSLLRKIFSRW